MRYLLAAFLAIAPALNIFSTNLIINEVMQSNVFTLYHDYEFPDSWIELYNPNPQPESLKGYAIGLDADYANSFPLEVDTIVPPGGYILIYCDKTGSDLHTDFRIDSGKGSVCIFKDGVLVEKLDLKKQPAPDVAWGRWQDGADAWGYQCVPTPGSANSGLVADAELLPSPSISPRSAIIVAPVEVTIDWPSGFTPDSLSLMCVTFNGEEPDVKDAVSKVPVTFMADSNMVVKAKIISPRRISSSSACASYIYKERDTKLSIVSIIVDSEFLYGSLKGIMTDGPDSTLYDLYHFNKWRRPMNIEIFRGPNHECIISQLIEGRVYGSLSRNNRQKSLCIYANKRFGTKNFNTTQFWPSKPDVTHAKSMIIRNAGQDTYTRMADAYAQSLVGKLYPDIEWEDNHPAVVYINGKYCGHYNIRERSDEDWFESNRGTENVDIVENYNDVVTGDSVHSSTLHKLLLNPSTTFSDISPLIDVDNWLLVLAYNTYGNNVDFPTNNMRIWRHKTEGSKWRIILKDMDMWFARWTYGFPNYYDFIDSWLDEDNDEGYVPEVRALSLIINDPTISRRFADLSTFICGDLVQPDSALWLYHSMLDKIKDEYEPTVRYNYNQKDADWLMSVIEYQRYTRFTAFLNNRPLQIADHNAAKFNLGTPCKLYFDHRRINVKFNDVPLMRQIYDGYYFAGQTLKVDMEGNYALDAKIEMADGKEIHLSPEDNFLAIPAEALTVELQARHIGDTVATIASDNSANRRYLDLRGCLVRQPRKGEIYIEISHSGSRKIIY